MAITLRRRSGGRRTASISMAPMIDMVFLLLVFFMTASAMSQSGSKLELELPASSESQVPQDLSGRLVISLDAEGGIYLGLQKVGEAELRDWLSRLAESSASETVQIRADKGTPFRHVRRAMALAAESGIDDYVFSSYQD